MKSKPKATKRTTKPRRAARRGPGARRAQTAATGISARRWAELREQLQEAQETLAAIRAGEVDAVVVSSEEGSRIYSLTGAEEPYRIYVERMQEGAVTVSREAVILYCNRRFAEMVNTPLERVISSDLRHYLSADAWAAVAGIFEARDEVIKHQAQLYLSEDRIVPVNLTGSRFPIGNQDVACLVVTDLTDRKKHEDMRLAKEVAEKANQAKDAFLAALSHELRTPLNPTLMTATALEQDETLSPKVRESLAMIRRNIELEARLIDDLLDLTRVTQGKLELQLGPLDIHAVLALAMEICRSDIETKEQRLSLELEATDTVTEGDAVRLQQALWNLVRNATKFTPAKGTITVTTRNGSPGTITIEVRDTGIGFEPDGAEKLFRPFEQGGNHITRRFGGLGLGLTISRSIMISHGGTIHAASAGKGQGAVFTLELPLRAPRKATTPMAVQTSEGAAAPVGMRILLVEDHDDTRRSMEFLLRKSLYEVRSAATAQAALALAAAEKFDLVITDLGLPDASGLELMKILRDRHGLRGIATTGYGMEEDIEQTRRAGFQHHLTKPIAIDKLRQVIVEMGPAK